MNVFQSRLLKSLDKSFNGIVSNLQINLGKINIFMIPSTPIPEYGMFLHLVMLSNILQFFLCSIVLLLDLFLGMLFLKLLKILPFSNYTFCLSLVSVNTAHI